MHQNRHILGGPLVDEVLNGLNYHVHCLDFNKTNANQTLDCILEHNGLMNAWPSVQSTWNACERKMLDMLTFKMSLDPLNKWTHP